MYDRERFDKHWHLDPETGCHVWTGGTAWGYGVFWHDGISRRAHRWIVEADRGPIPAGMVVDHLCGNRSCVNVEHLEVVTQKENARRRSGSDTERGCIHGHDLSELVVKVYGGVTKRYCRACHRDRATAIRRRAGIKEREPKLPDRLECPHGHPVTADSVGIDINGLAFCRICRTERMREAEQERVHQQVRSSVSTVAT